MKHFSVLALLTSLLISNTAFTQSSCFTSLSDFSFACSSNIRCVDKGDFNGDGHQDLAMAIYTPATTNNVSIMLGNGDGSFGTPVTYNSGSRPLDIKVADFNGDANLDLAVACFSSNYVAILLGTGSGTFGLPTTFTTGAATGPNGIDAGDFDGDGNLDLVVSYQTSTQGVSFLKGNGDGTFATNVNYAMTGAPRSVTVGDFNGDTNLDIATANSSGSSVSLRLGNGDGTFAARTDFSVQSGPFNLKAGDLNNDGDLDLAVSNATTGSISLLIGNGAGSFAAADNYAITGGPNEIVLSDFDEDGKLDVTVVNNTDNTMAIFINSGINTAGNRLNAFVKYPVMGTPQAMIEGDYNEDSHIDLAVPASAAPNRVVILLGDGAGSFNAGVNIATGAGPNGIAMGDFNGDSKSDLVTANKTANNISFFAGNGDGTYATGVTFATGVSPVAVYAADMNGDGDLDVVTADYAVHTVSILLGNGSGSFSAPTSHATGGNNPNAIVCKDFNGDGDIDIAVSNEASANFGVLLGTGGGTFAAAVTYAVGTTPKGIIADNFNTGDSFLDIAVANFGSNNISVCSGTGTGTFGAATNFTTSTGPTALASGDLNNDGKSDIVAACNTTAKASVFLASGASSFAAKVDYTTDVAPQSITIADFNNDTHLDIATANKVAAGVSGSVSVLMGKSSPLGTFAAKTDFTTSNNSIGIVAGLIDAGTAIDLAVVNFDANNVSILLNTTATITASGSTTFCAGGSVTLTSSTGNSYLWSSSQTTQAINVTTSGTYHVTVSNLSGLCNSQSNDVIVTVNPLPTILSITGSTTICLSTSTSLTAVGSTGTLDIDWYSASTGGTLLSSTDSYTTPVLASTTTYYVAAVEPSTGCVMSPRFPVVVTVGDATLPVITGMPSNISLNAGASCTAIATWTAPSATDNCTLISLTPNHTSGSTFSLGTTTVTYTATDGAGNIATASFTVTVTDVTNPTITGTPATINTNVAAGTCAKNVSWTAPTASDNCSIVSFTTDHAIGSSFPVGTTVVTYTATDGSGHVTTSSFNVIVTDNILPTITGMPSNQTLSATAGTCGAIATWTTPTASDNCGIASLTSTSTSGSTFPVGVTTVTYTATDVNGNIKTSSFTITVTDAILPVITGTPANINANTGAASCTATVTWTAPTASDNCTVSSLVASNAPGSSFPIGVTTVTYTATDASGNIATTSFTVTVTDNVLPSFTGFPSNFSVVSTPGLCSATGTWTAPGTSDNCGVASVTSTATSGSSFPVGVTTVTYTVTDVNGNVTNQSFNITVIDNEAPVMIGCPTTQTVCENDTVFYTTPTATDNCSGVTVTQLAGLPSGSLFPVGTTLCTFRATDAAGNLTNCNFNIIVNAAPTATLNIPTTNICNTAASISLTGGGPAGGAYSGPGVSAGVFSPSVAGIGTHTITYTSTNVSGCTDSATDVIIVDDCTGMNDLVNSNLVKLYPNPTNGLFNLEILSTTNFENTSFTIYSNMGQIVYTGKLNASLTNVDLSELSNGVYVVKVIGSAINSTSQLIIQK